ncbi:uncharacterized protein [Halyomorpha halys]|uniref:uncharacterized protein n=1 Tax=Halyomorpha halys TaxID=286706 RepID=UPI0006D4C747|nr:uncharacterized protein LOC106684528 [Halyomorpha halys]
MNKKEKVVPCSSRVIAYNHKTKKNRNMTVYEGVRKLLANDQKALELFNSNKVNVTVRLKSDGSVLGVSLTPKDIVSSSDSSLTDMETLPTTVSDDEKMGNNSGDEMEDLGSWWKEDSSSEEEEDNLDFTLVLEDDNETEPMETAQIPDVIEATQLPPGRMSGALKKVESQQPVPANEVEPDSTVSLAEERDSNDSDDESEPWMECWNCRAPEPVAGIYREDADNMRMIFCCEKPTRIKPTNAVIESTAKSYPYDSWVHHSFS